MRKEQAQSTIAFRVLLTFFGFCAAARGADLEGVEFFERKIRPMLVEHCYPCHSEENGVERKGGLWLDSAQGVLRGGESGAVVVPGNPQNSRLIEAIRYLNPELQMPPKYRLPESVVTDFERWVSMGAPDPRSGGSVPAALPTVADTTASRKAWPFIPVLEPHVPAVEDEAWALSPLDRFVLAGLESHGLEPAEPADKRTLIRRATYDLTGLPPTPAEVDAFIADASEEAFARVVNRLLASPAYGERWARHWLDLVRYADSKDERFMGQPVDFNEIWRYRDWVVNALNKDYPYDQFLVDQIAGDILSAQSPDGLDYKKLVATGMLAVGNWEFGDADKRKLITDIVDDQIDTIGRGVLGLTLACARCHDHKFDPISTKDYYALAGFFLSTHVVPAPNQPALPTDMLAIRAITRTQAEQRRHYETEAAEIEKQLAAMRQSHREALALNLRSRTRVYLSAAYEHVRSLRGPSQLSVESLALKHGLDERLLRRWLAYLRLPDGEGPHRAWQLETRFDLDNQPDLVGWGELGTPWMIVNTSHETRKIASLSLPPRSASLHPSHDRPVSVAWQSSLDGVVVVAGHVSDGDASCGNGAAWKLSRIRGPEQTTLASGLLENGAARKLDDAALARVEVHVGDLIALTIEARNSDSSCDTTNVELHITDARTSARSWSLSADMAARPSRGHALTESVAPDSFWRAYSPLPSPPVNPVSLMGRWLGAVNGGRPEDEITKLALAVEQAVLGGTPSEIEAPVHAALRAADGFFLRGLDVEAGLSDELRSRRDVLTARLEEIKSELARPITFVNGAREGGVPGSEHAGFADARVHIRGSYNSLGPVVHRGFPRVLAAEPRPPLPPQTSGRLELARWLASPDNPMTARVMVNRLWQHHFGQGIVRTPDNFGKLGTPPTHPELLDYLAMRFIESGWSLKAMHRLVLNSAAYRQSCHANPRTLQTDPDNLLIGRMNRKRLEVEALRDGLLAIAGRLETTIGGRAARDPSSPRRTLYILTARSDNTTFRELFDGADSAAIIAKRNESTVAPQSLFMMNNPLVLEQVRAIVGRLLAEGPPDDAGRVGMLYQLLLGRPPDDREQAVSLEVLASLRRGSDDAWRALTHALVCSNEFIYLD